MSMAIKYAMKKRAGMAKGGDAGGCSDCSSGTCMAHGGVVDRIMRKRKAAGGDVVADFEPNEFDVLELEPAEEFAYTGANSGDELGNSKLDEDDHDLVARIMRSRAKKDRLPRPA